MKLGQSYKHTKQVIMILNNDARTGVYSGSSGADESALRHSQQHELWKKLIG
jgi:hypothetical protein